MHYVSLDTTKAVRGANNASVYFMRAYEANPYDPYLCFLIAQAYLGRALNRQSDNRNYQIAQVRNVIHDFEAADMGRVWRS